MYVYHIYLLNIVAAFNHLDKMNAATIKERLLFKGNVYCYATTYNYCMICLDIARGMEYLSSLYFVHCDLATNKQIPYSTKWWRGKTLAK